MVTRLISQTFRYKVHEITACSVLRAGYELRKAQPRNAFDVGVKITEVGVGEVSATGVEFDNLPQGGRIPLWKYGPVNFGIAQTGSLEIAVDSLTVKHRHWLASSWIQLDEP